ncbi:MAG: ATP-binding cassette domain-containing protein [Bdellovibrionales bacterium]|nr:ATP-binding cassette domain-containing protein [Bdellovibrionales bacterium]
MGMANILLQMTQGYKSYGPKILFENAQFSINEGEHIGLIGPNGAGKSTLFRILIGEEDLDEGNIVSSQGLRIGYLKQEDDFDITQPLESLLEKHCRIPLWDLKALGRGLGLDEESFSRPLREFSGGYKMRFKLLHLIGQDPQLLLLDEPTNYLDLESLIVLEKFLIELKSAFILISHDREFLRLTTDHILEVEQGDFTKFNGSLDDYFEFKESMAELQRKKAANIAAQRAQIQQFADRFRAKATKARQVQSRLKQLGRLESVQIKSLPVKARIHLPEPKRTGKEILKCDKLTLGYGDKVILEQVDLRLVRGEHLGVVGVNGAGKSTLLKTLAGILPPLKGHFQWGPSVEVGYYAQHVPESLNLEHTVEQALFALADPAVTQQDVRDMAGALLFSNEDREKKVKILSGGEKSRVALGQILLQRSPCLIFDEPTNHLDFHTVEALTQALKNYPGTLILVSHDRSFLSRVTSKILEIRDGRAEVYPGTYDEYVWSLQKGAWADKEVSQEQALTSRAASSGGPNESSANKKQNSQAVRVLKAKIRKIEEEMQKVETAVSDLHKELIHLRGEEVVRAQQKLKAFEDQKHQLEMLWMEEQEQLELLM